MSPSSASVVVCIYTERRWDQILEAIDSAARQPETHEVIVVVDHNDLLLQRVRNARSGVRVAANRFRPGLSGARNTGIELAEASITAFLDDDARAADDWLLHLLAPFEDASVEGVGGRAVPIWPASVPSKVLAPELLWIVGCTFTGQPVRRADVRNVMGCAMAFRTETLRSLGGFDLDTGRVGRIPLGGEETELCIRLRMRHPFARVVFEPLALVEHNVSADRVGWPYLVRRSFYEGVSKSVLSRKLGERNALETERAYTRRVLPRGVVREVFRPATGGPRRALGIVVSLVLAAVGYVYGRIAGDTSPGAAEMEDLRLKDAA